MRITHLFTATVAVGAVHDLGETPLGRRRIVSITGGSFAGPDLSGAVLPGGADWQVVRPDGVVRVEARYTLETAKGALIDVRNLGYRHGPSGVMARLAAGEAVDPGAYYFRTTPSFETSDEGLFWLNHHVFVASAERHPDRVVVHVHRVD